MIRFLLTFSLLALWVFSSGCNLVQENLVEPVEDIGATAVSSLATLEQIGETAEQPTSTPVPPPPTAPPPTPIPSFTTPPPPAAEPSPVISPTPTSPNPEELLVRASNKMAAAESYHFEWLIEYIEIYQGKEYVKQKVTFSGDFQQPRKFQGVVNGPTADRLRIITIGDEVYMVDPESGAWSGSSWEMLQEQGLILSPNMPSGVYFDLAYFGQELVDDTAVHHIGGKLPAVEEGIKESVEEFWIGVDDDLYYQVRSEFAGEEEDFKVRITKRFSEYNKPLEIAAPPKPPQVNRHISGLLGLSYLLPEGWTVQEWGEAGCEAVNCRGERIELGHEDGPFSALSIAGLDEAAEAALLDELLGYEESEIGGKRALWRADDNGLEAVLLFDEESLHVRGSWKQNPADEATVRQILGSILPFWRYALPGMISLRLPWELRLVVGPEPGDLFFGSKEIEHGEIEPSPLQIDEGEVAIWFSENDEPDVSPEAYLGEILNELGESFEITERVQTLAINGQPAAAASYRPTGSESGPLQTLTVVQGPDRLLVMGTVAHADSAVTWQPAFKAIRDSLVVQNKLAAPELAPEAVVPDEYISYQTHVFALRYPPDWITNRGLGPGSFSPPDARKIAFDLYEESVSVTEDLSRGDASESDLQELLSGALVSAWWTRPDVQIVSDVATAENDGQELAAVWLGATDNEGAPLYGVLAVIRRGDETLNLLGWVRDFAAHREEIENIIRSVEFRN